jgi:hypothetical protein
MPSLHLRAYHQPGEPDVQLVALGQGGEQLVANVPMPAQLDGDTPGLLVNREQWLALQPRGQHHPARY